MAPRRDSRPSEATARHEPWGRPDAPSLRWAFGALADNAVDFSAPVDVDDFQELRRQGLFDDDGRNPPPSWWAR